MDEIKRPIQGLLLLLDGCLMIMKLKYLSLEYVYVSCLYSLSTMKRKEKRKKMSFFQFGGQLDAKK